MRKHFVRLWLTILNKPPVDTHRGYVGEVFHALMNIPVEFVRMYFPKPISDRAQIFTKIILALLGLGIVAWVFK